MATADFTRALYAAYSYEKDRGEAESYLIALKESAEGFGLACDILAAEPFDQLRAFWAFNTLIFHMNAVSSSNSAITSPEDAQRVYEILCNWIRRVVVERELPDFILNKHAQCTVIGLYAFFPDAWPSFFDDLFDFIDMKDRGAGDQAVAYFLRVFEYIDEVVVDRNAQRAPSQRERDMAIKDLMREICVRRAVDVWCNILSMYHNRNPNDGLEVAQLCLRVLGQYVEWIDVNLLLTPYWVNLLYFLMSIHPLRVGACECIGQLVAKKQAPQVKVETLQALNVVEALDMLSPLVTSQLPTTEEEEQFVVSVALLMISAAEHLVNCIDSDQNVAPVAGEMLRAVVPHILNLMMLPLLSLRDCLLDFIQSYSKWAPVEELQAVMESVFLQTCRPGIAGPLSVEQAAKDIEGDVGSSATFFEERDVEHRRQMHNSLRLLYRRNSQLVMSHCQYIVEQAVNSEPSSLSEHDAEGAIRYVYELGEMSRVEQLRPPPDDQTPPHEFYQLTVAILHSRLVREHPGPLIQLALFEMLDRFYSFFFFSRHEVETLLSLLLESPNGICNPHPRARSRICYVFCRLAQNLKALFVPFVDPVAAAFAGFLSPADDDGSCLTPSDKADLYEGLGIIYAASSALERCEETLQSIVQHMDAVGAAIVSGSCSSPEQMAVSVANCIGYLTSLAKGVGGAEANRMPDSPSAGPSPAPAALLNNNQVAGAPPPNALDDADAAMNSAVAAARQDPTHNVFLSILEHVVELALACLPFNVVREKTLLCLQQLLNILGVASLPSIEALLSAMLATTTISECPRILRVLYQTVNKTRGASAVVMGRSLLPRTMERVGGFGDVSDLRAEFNVISESARELAEVYKLYFTFIQALVQNAAVAALQHPDIQPYIGILMNQLNGAIRTPIESELARPALIAITRLTGAWCDPDSSFETFLFDTILPSIIDELTGGSIDIRNDPKVVFLYAELCTLLRTTTHKLGDRSLFRLYGLLTSTLPFVSFTEADEYCGVVRDSVNARNPTPLKQSTKQLLEMIYARRSGGGC